MKKTVDFVFLLLGFFAGVILQGLAIVPFGHRYCVF